MFLNMFSKLGFCFWSLYKPLFKFIKPGLHALWKRGICWLQMHVVFLQLFLFSNEQAHMVHMTTAAPHNSQHFQTQFQRYTHAQLGQQTTTLHLGFNSFNTFDVGLEKPRVKTSLQEGLEKPWKTSSLEKTLAAMAGEWKDWEDWQDWGPPTRYGYYGLNCKNKPSGSGTTHSNRNAQTARKQWSNLIIARPDAEESLVEQAAALEKAAKKAKVKLLHLPPSVTIGKKAKDCFGKCSWASFGKGCGYSWRPGQEREESKGWAEGAPGGEGGRWGWGRWVFGKGHQ